MNEHKIPAEMLDAATAAIRELRETRGLGFAGSAEIARIALNAAGVPALIAEWDSLKVHAIELGCDLDNERRRCAVLTGDLANRLARIAELEAAICKVVQSKEVVMPIDLIACASKLSRDEEITKLLKPEARRGASE